MSSNFTGRRALRTVSAAALAISAGISAPLLLAGSAGAATSAAPATAAFSSSDHGIVYTAAPGQTNKVTVTATKSTGKVSYLIDDAVSIKAGEKCSYPDSADHTKVSCSVETLESQDPYATLLLNLGDGNDTVGYDNKGDETYYFARADLGPGKDTWKHIGGDDGNAVLGGTGDDTLTMGNYGTAAGGDGKDTIRIEQDGIAAGGNQNDVIYAEGEESIVEGGAGDDEIHGGAGRQHLKGDDGDDELHGGSGADFMYGGKGNDVLYGDSGNDTIYGNSGDDGLFGGSGQDVLSGGPGRDIVRQD
ncbi:calcium-binding protein [Streptomyces formicae]|uniref:Alkaline phosphatase n=1 Tax=Streptomyces formicae TaxID=1616117 RepID=A0A291QAG0_9ACTN|nr:calcium-binding protein [Streptomyces formicae]ATL28487.1 Alkaline phosphatase [Streptomyces formicae]